MTRDRNEEGEQVILCQCEECNLNVNVDGTRGVKRLWSEHIQHTLDKGHTFNQGSFPQIDADVDMQDIAQTGEDIEHFGTIQNQFRRRRGGEARGPPELRQGAYEYNNEHHFTWPIAGEPTIVQTVALITLFSSLVFSLSRRSSDILLGLLKCLVEVVLGRTGDERTARILTAPIPKGSGTIRTKCRLDGGSTTYAVCPTCSATHQPQEREDTDEQDETMDLDYSLYPEICSNQHGTVCNERLLDEKKKPLKSFIYSSVLEYIGALISRHSLETAADEACDALMRSIGESPPDVRGPFQADFLRSFEGPYPGRLFIDRGNEIRLAFSLSVDFFNIQGVRAGAAQASIGVMSLICLNLPENVRHKQENIYLAGIIPGPKEPSLEKINHFLRPLVEEFQKLWDPGVRFAQTATCRNGRLVRAVIAIVVCDLPAARKVAGLLGHTSTKFLCSHCHCHKSRIHQVDVVFPRRSPETLRSQATEWRTARTEAERKQITSRYGVRWSELWNLPYWNPSKQLVVDPMHCLLLGLVHNHFVDILPLYLKAASQAPAEPPPYVYDFQQVPTIEEDPGNPIYASEGEHVMSDSDINQVSEIHKMLLKAVDYQPAEMYSKLRSPLEKKSRPALAFVWRSLGLPQSSLADQNDLRGAAPRTETLKRQYAGALTRWRFTKPLRSEIPPIQVVTVELINHVQCTIAGIRKPTWVRSVPLNFGMPSQGKIKADEWRTLATIHLPLALMTYYFEDNKMGDIVKARFRTVMDHTMELVQAVNLLFRESTSGYEKDEYEKHIKKYISQLREKHPAASLLPNMHMATHIPEFLTLFGSVYSWWTFPFERIIGMLQNIPNNNKMGQVETTIHKSFVATSRLKQWFSRDGSPPGVQACLKVIEEACSQEAKSSVRARNLDELGPAIIDEFKGGNPHVEPILKEYKDQLRDRWQLNGVDYCTRRCHVGNSQVIYDSTPCPELQSGGTLAAGYIEGIIHGKDPKFIVGRLCPAQDGADRYRCYNDFPVVTFSRAPFRYEIIDGGAIRGHFAATSIPGFQVVLPLCKF